MNVKYGGMGEGRLRARCFSAGLYDHSGSRQLSSRSQALSLVCVLLASSFQEDSLHKGKGKMVCSRLHSLPRPS